MNIINNARYKNKNKIPYRAHQAQNVAEQTFAVVPHHLRVRGHHDLDEIFTRQGSTWSPSHGGIRFHFRVLAILLAQIISSSLHGVVSVTFQTIPLLDCSHWLEYCGSIELSHGLAHSGSFSP